MPRNARMSSNLIRLCSLFKHALSIFSFQMIGIFSTCSPTNFNAAYCTLTYYLSYLDLPRYNFTSFIQCTSLTIPILTTLLQLKYQSSSPFVTHPTTMLIVVSSSTVNYLAYIAHLRFPRHCHVAAATYLCLICSSYASVASLGSLLFPDSFRPYMYSVFALVLAAEVFCFCKRVMEAEGDEGVGFGAYRRRMNRFLNKLCRFAANPAGQHQSHILPV